MGMTQDGKSSPARAGQIAFHQALTYTKTAGMAFCVLSCLQARGLGLQSMEGRQDVSKQAKKAAGSDVLEREKHPGKIPPGRKTERQAMPRTSQPATTAYRRGAIPSKQAPGPQSRRFSALAGGLLILAAALWFLWLLMRQMSPGMVSFHFPFPNPLPARSANVPVDPLAAAGVTLAAPLQGQEPGLTQQQAVLVAGQVEPQAATRATEVDARYALFSYQGSASGFHNVPVWVIHYRQVAEPRPDTAADPGAAGAKHDFYVFLEASSGRELLAIWF